MNDVSLSLPAFAPIDWVLIGVVLGFAWIGWRRGLLVSALSFVGFVGGALAAAFGLPVFVQALGPGTGRALALGAGILLAALAGQFLLGLVGQRLRAGVHWQPARFLDAAGGAVLSIAALAMIAWIVSSALAGLPRHPVTEQVRNSQVLLALDATVPDVVRDAFTGLRDSVDASSLPQVFSGLAEFQGPQVDAPDPAVTKLPVIDRANASVLRINGRACGVQSRGSGFVFDPGLVLTNAHVVAGVDRVRVDGNGETQRAKVVFFDPRLDLAVLALPTDDAPALPWSGSLPESGQDAVVLGYPDGGGLQASSARVRGTLVARGNDINGRSGVEREVIAFRGALRPGSSGSPLLSAEGEVLGMVFGRGLGEQETGYAITGEQLRSVLKRSNDADGATGTEPGPVFDSRGVDTGDCRP